MVKHKQKVTLSTLLQKNQKLRNSSTGGSPTYFDNLNPLRKSVKTATLNLISEQADRPPLSKPKIRKVDFVPSPELLMFDDFKSCHKKLTSIAKSLKLEFTSKYCCRNELIEIEHCKIAESLF